MSQNGRFSRDKERGQSLIGLVLLLGLATIGWAAIMPSVASKFGQIGAQISAAMKSTDLAATALEPTAATPAEK